MRNADLPPGFWEKMDGGYFYHCFQLDLKRVYLEITRRCNFSCITCIRHSWKDEIGDMDSSLFSRLLDELESYPQRPLIYFGGFGEPFFHPEIIEMISKVKKRGFRLRIATNGCLLSEEILEFLVEKQVEEIIVSCDSVEDSVFKAIRTGGSLEKLKGNLQKLQKIKIEKKRTYPRVSLEFVLMKKNADDLKRLPVLAAELGAGHILITNLLPHTLTMKEEIVYGEKYEPAGPLFWPGPEKEYPSIATADFPRMEWGALRSCPFIERNSVSVSWKGDVAPCYPLLHRYCYYIFGRQKEVTPYFLGNVREENLRSIWQKKEYIKFRNRVRLFQFPSCVDCELSESCDFPAVNDDCWGNSPSCADCLWAQNIIRCP